MKKLLVAGLAALAMALSLEPRFSQPLVADTQLPAEYMLADGNNDTGGD